LGNTVTVSAKIPRELKEKLRKLRINVSHLIRVALEREVKRIEEERLMDMAEQASLSLRNIPSKEIVKVIREVREER